MKILEKKFKALGFVEVLIAIVVVSIVSAVFFSIATDAMKDLIQTERMETMARLAKNGANIVQEVANQEKADQFSQEEYFPKAKGQCYLPVEDQDGDPVYSFAKEEGSGFIFCPDGDRSCVIDKVLNEYVLFDNYFLLMCIVDIEEDSWAYVKFWVGDIKLEGVRTTDSDVKDFTYYAIIKI